MSNRQRCDNQKLSDKKDIPVAYVIGISRSSSHVITSPPDSRRHVPVAIVRGVPRAPNQITDGPSTATYSVPVARVTGVPRVTNRETALPAGQQVHPTYPTIRPLIFLNNDLTIGSRSYVDYGQFYPPRIVEQGEYRSPLQS
ncbi:hypothetical protein GCK72_023936 [Caenorhabditis remanei]|uniref:Uncharacterized protein n=1 Tax=Caenorhabditis remanei TaxID=31234 RepID=A0A6A5FYD3_CAERE|nr:hypothetical protein GCK72_023936 [Caenorhabditis remanei]KAF1747474.1 hypothetical protein GCK72_023936 [Caenorhabditis remanei]